MIQMVLFKLLYIGKDRYKYNMLYKADVVRFDINISI